VSAVGVAEPAARTQSRPGKRPPNAARKRLSGTRLRVFIISLIFIPICLAWIYPFLWTVSAAFKTNEEVFAGPGLIPHQIEWGNFARAWNNGNVGRQFINTLILACGAVGIVVFTTGMMGYVLGRYKFRGKPIIVGLLAMAVFIPEGYTIIPIFQMVDLLHVNNSLLGIILAESGGAHVLYILLFAGFFAQLPNELEESAVIDGASFLRVFWNVMLPLAKPVIATTVILQFMASWNSFFLPLVLTFTRPELQTLGVGIYSFQGEFVTDWSGMAAAATISQVPIIVLFLLLQRYFIEGIAGAVKM
jgi:raffinose/stachyose/melibiose transport system permease protein